MEGSVRSLRHSTINAFSWRD